MHTAAAFPTQEPMCPRQYRTLPRPHPVRSPGATSVLGAMAMGCRSKHGAGANSLFIITTSPGAAHGWDARKMAQPASECLQRCLTPMPLLSWLKVHADDDDADIQRCG